MRLDCILSIFKLIRLSLYTNTLTVVEDEPYLNQNRVRFVCRGLSKYLTLLPLLTTINRVPFKSFQIKVVVKFFKSFPSIIRYFA